MGESQSELAGPVEQIDALREVGALYWSRGWSWGTSSNYSVRLSSDPFRLLITASGKDKSKLGRQDFVTVGTDGKPVAPWMPKPSAETLLHVVAAADKNVGAVLHTHSPACTVLSDVFAHQGYVEMSGYEMLKGLDGIGTHETTVRIKIFENTQDIAALSREVQGLWSADGSPLRYGFLLRRHGLYTWGRDLDEAKRHVEIIEFLLEVVSRRMQIELLSAAAKAK